jgi:hypothetical protein
MKMALTCPKCGKMIEDSNILTDQDMTYCDSCGEIYTISKLGNQQSDKIEDNAGHTPEEGVEQLSKIIAEKKRLIKTQNKIISENQQLKEKHKKSSRDIVVSIILGIIGITISIIIGYVKYNGMKNLHLIGIQDRIYLESRYNTLFDDYERSKNIWLVSITSIRIGNWNKNTNVWISRPGEPLISEKIQYLRPRIALNSHINANMVFSVNIFDPMGNLKKEKTSPENFTYTMNQRWINRGSDQIMDFPIWEPIRENDDKIKYQAGKWIIEIWYNNILLISENFEIEP